VITRSLACLFLILLLFAPPPAHADGFTYFTGPPLGDLDRMVINPYADYHWGITFTALPFAEIPGEIGIAKVSATTVCLDSDPDAQVLGTAQEGSGDIGDGRFPVRVDFDTAVVPPVFIHAEVLSRAGAIVYITLHDADGNVVGTNGVGGANLHEDVCTAGGPLNRSGVYTAYSLAPVKWVVIEATEVFVLNWFSWVDHAVAAETSTWGRVKALYRD